MPIRVPPGSDERPEAPPVVLLGHGVRRTRFARRLADTPVASSALQVALLITYAAMMFGVRMRACVVPARRALRVQPTVALRAE